MGQDHPGLSLGSLLHGLGQVALPLPWASMSSSVKWVESHLPYRGMVRTLEANVPNRCSRDASCPPLPSPVEENHGSCQVRAPPGPTILLCGMVSGGEGFIRALLTTSASLERELFPKEAGAQERKCLFIRTSHFAKLRIYTRASYTTAFGLPHPSFCRDFARNQEACSERE